MSKEWRLLKTLVLSLLSSSAWAQMDSSSAVLLRSSGRVVSPENLDSSLYTIRAPEAKATDEESIEIKPSKPIAPKAVRAKVDVPTAAPVPPPEPQPIQATAVPNDPTPAVTPADPSSVSQQMQELILGGSYEEIEEYRRQIHPADARKNMLEISFAPAFFYEDAESSYSYRNYTSRGPGFGAGMNLWLTPFFGVQSNYFTSVTGAVERGSLGASPLDLQVFDVGIRFRRHFSLSRRAPQLIWGIDYQEKSDHIGRDSTQNIGHKSSGWGLSAEAIVPSSLSYSHTLSIDMQPRLNHSERASGVSVNSGTSNQSNALRLSVGGQWSLDRGHALFWKTQCRFERNLFQGSASAIDPQSGQTPTDVATSNNLLMIYFGFKWGS